MPVADQPKCENGKPFRHPHVLHVCGEPTRVSVALQAVMATQPGDRDAPANAIREAAARCLVRYLDGEHGFDADDVLLELAPGAKAKIGGMTFTGDGPGGSALVPA